MLNTQRYRPDSASVRRPPSSTTASSPSFLPAIQISVRTSPKKTKNFCVRCETDQRSTFLPLPFLAAAGFSTSSPSRLFLLSSGKARVRKGRHSNCNCSKSTTTRHEPQKSPAWLPRTRRAATVATHGSARRKPKPKRRCAPNHVTRKKKKKKRSDSTLTLLIAPVAAASLMRPRGHVSASQRSRSGPRTGKGAQKKPASKQAPVAGDSIGSSRSAFGAPSKCGEHSYGARKKTLQKTRQPAPS